MSAEASIGCEELVLGESRAVINYITLDVKGDERGSLISLESELNIPFPIKRVYYLFSTAPGVPRGFHAHKELTQVAICLAGKCRMIMDDGIEVSSFWLESPSKALIIPPMIWHEMHDFSLDCVLMVVASAHYDEGDYIRDYDHFKRLVEGG